MYCQNTRAPKEQDGLEEENEACGSGGCSI